MRMRRDMSSNGSSASAPQRSRFSELVSSIPLVTLTLIGICVIVYVADNLGDFGQNMAMFSISPYLVLKHAQLYRIITAAFCHGGLMHIGMNMMSLYQLGGGLEPMFGSLQYSFIIIIFTIAVGLLYVCLGWIASLYDPSYMYSSAVGFSGVLFAMAADEASLSPHPTRSVFGLFSVPTKVYPWILMIVLQIMLPNVSFLGHLAGIIVGMAHTFGAFQWLVPSLSAMRKIEQLNCMRRIVRWGPYKLVPAAEVLREGTTVRQQIVQACQCLAVVVKPITDCIRPLLPQRSSRVRIPGDVETGTREVAPRQTAGYASRATQQHSSTQSPNPTNTQHVPNTTAATEQSPTLSENERKARASKAAAAAAARVGGIRALQGSTPQPASPVPDNTANAAGNSAGRQTTQPSGLFGPSSKGYAEVPQDDQKS